MEWKTSDSAVEYKDAVTFMEARAAAIRSQTAEELIWLLEHPPIYTAGTSAKPADLLDKSRFPVHETGRGGEYTYHGPGQRVAYVMLDLKRRFAPTAPDIRKFVWSLEDWIIQTLAILGIKGERRQGRIGIWVLDASGAENKIAALGIRIRQGVSFHGIAININPDLSHYAGIVPCGIAAHGVTSLHALGVKATMEEVDAALKDAFPL